jgi:hypothetical protein
MVMTFIAAKRIASSAAERRFYCRGCGYIASGTTANRWHECPTPPGPPCGPGCQLRRTLAWFVRDDGKCGCKEYAAEMDRDGPDGCEARIDEIVAHLVEQAAKKSVFLGAVPSAAVTVVVRRAIEAARAEAAAATPATPPPG